MAKKIYQNPSLEILSEQKGSNPGGFCIYNDRKNNLKSYFKYCVGSKIPRGYSSLKSDHQPFYEAITFEFARRLGLKTPNFFVLLNNKNNVSIKNNVSSHDHSRRHSYFVSKKICEPKVSNLDEIGSKIIQKERVYLEGLMISDILGKRQNYLVLPNSCSQDFKVFYLDLGCSFVHAVGGFIYFPNGLRNLDRGCKKRERHNLKHKTIIAADDDSLINLGEFIDNFENLTLPTLNPLAKKNLDELICKEEIDEIRSYLVHGLCKNINNFKKAGLFV